MIANVIHNQNNKSRIERLQSEIRRQKWAPELRYWEAIYKEPTCKGISQAHKQIVRWAKKEGLPFVWIMEDDIRVPNIYGLEHFKTNIPKDFDLYLGGIYSGQIQSGNTVKKFAGLHCYIVHERFYESFLMMDEEKHLDYALSQVVAKYVVCNPFAAVQHNGYSENVGREINYDRLLKGYKIF